MEDFATLSTASAAVGGFESIWMALAQSERAEEAEAAHASSHDYHPELATPELIVQIRRLLATERRIGRLVCRYLADLADRIHGQRDRELLAYVDEFHAAACFFDLGPREVRERVRIGRALRQLPQIESAFIAGELSYSRVREVTRVAQPDTESEWLDCARHLDMRALERRVAGTAEELAAHQNRWDPFHETRVEWHGATNGTSETSDVGAHFDQRRAESRGAGGLLETSDAGAHGNEVGAESRGAADGLLETSDPAAHFDQRTAKSRGVAQDSSEGFDPPGGHCDGTRSESRRTANRPLETLGATSARAPSSPRMNAADESASRQVPREQVRLHTRWLDHDSLRVTFELPAEAWALLERALEGARRKASVPLTDADALAAVARDALASQNQADASDPGCSVVVYECVRCSKSELDTGVGSFEIDAATAATLGCGAREIDLASEGHGVQRGGPLPEKIRHAVLLRDRCRCRVPGCNRRRYVDVHHLVSCSEGDEHSRRNCITLCSTHHRRLHQGKLQITGDADAEPVFQLATRQPIPSFGEQGDGRRRGDNALDDENASEQRLRRRHASDGECAAPGSRRGWQNDDIDTGATHLGTAPTRPERHSLDAENASAPAGPERLRHEADDDDIIGASATHLGMLNDTALRLLQIMGRRGNWNTDALLEKSALPFPELQHALLLLELEGRVRRRGAEFDPV
jgi:hypothetical protein